jgi:hypothetical protein
MNDDKYPGTLVIAGLCLTATMLVVGYAIGFSIATKQVIKESQTSAVKQGAARWTSNRESGEAEFNYIQCLKPEAK